MALPELTGGSVARESIPTRRAAVPVCGWRTVLEYGAAYAR